MAIVIGRAMSVPRMIAWSIDRSAASCRSRSAGWAGSTAVPGVDICDMAMVTPFSGQTSPPSVSSVSATSPSYTAGAKPAGPKPDRFSIARLLPSRLRLRRLHGLVGDDLHLIIDPG